MLVSLLSQAGFSLGGPQLWLLLAVVAAVVLLFVLSAVRSLIRICNPNEILVFSGRTHTLPDGSTVGFRVVTGGRAYRTPIIETVSAMDMRLIPVELHVANAYSQGGIPLNVQAIANVKISNNPKTVMNAIERFLDAPLDKIARVAKETLEGSLRGVLAKLTPEQVNEDRLEFAHQLEKEVQDDLEKLGLQLDTLKIQHVHDDVKYLDSISRQQIALILRDVENAESDSNREATQEQSDANARAREAQENAKQNIARRQNDLRRYKAELNGQIQAEEERTAGAALEARAIAEQELQSLRRAVEEKRLEAEISIPAEIQREAQVYLARAAAAPIAENGAALSKSLALLAEAWREAGASAREIFLVQQIDTVAQQVAQSVANIEIGEVNLVDSGDGKALANYVRSFPASVIAVLEELQGTIGVDIPSVIRGAATAKKES